MHLFLGNGRAASFFVRPQGVHDAVISDLQATRSEVNLVLFAEIQHLFRHRSHGNSPLAGFTIACLPDSIRYPLLGSGSDQFLVRTGGDDEACLAHGIVGVVSQVADTFAAVAAALGQVGVLGREEPFVDAGVEAEDGGLVVAESVETGGGFFSLADGLPAVGERVLALVDLHGRAAAVMDNPARNDIAFVVVNGKVIHDRIGHYPIFACYQHITTMKESALEKAAKRVESIEGMDFRDAVELRYVREQRGYRYLCARWKTNNRMIARLIPLAGFSVRHGGEAVKTQWVDAEERRKAAGKLLAQINHELALAGLHVRQGVNKSNSEMMRRVSDKLKTNSSFFRKEVREKALKHSLESRARHPERMSALRLPASCNEAVLLEFLRGKGIRFEFRKRIGRYIVDFYLPGAALAIDCQGAGRFPLSYQRHVAIAAKGVQVVYCVNSFVKKSDFSDLYEHIAHRQVSGLLPSHRCEDTVIWGARGPRPFGADTDKFTCERSYMNGCYKLVLTASSDNHVAGTDVLDVPPVAGKG